MHNSIHSYYLLICMGLISANVAASLDLESQFSYQGVAPSPFVARTSTSNHRVAVKQANNGLLDVSAFIMVGVVSAEQKPSLALVRDKQGKLYSVSVGDRLATVNAVVTMITVDYLEVTGKIATGSKDKPDKQRIYLSSS
jgi:Tfp pilus assembly protein PilP